MDRASSVSILGADNLIGRVVMAMQVAGELYYDIDGQLAEIKRQLRQIAGYPYDPAKLKVALQDAIEGKFPESAKPEVPAAAPIKSTSLFSVIASTDLGAVVGKPTKQCFTGSRYAYRDGDFDPLLPADQPMAAACTVTTLVPAREATFAEWVRAILGVTADTPVEMLGPLLKERGHTMTLTQVEDMVEAAERKAKNGMRVDGWGNFFFMENEDGSVSVGYVRRAGRGWSAYVFSLGRGSVWLVGSRLLVRNLDASKL